jgi:D-alanyl-D-alanine carboxypeptidase
MGGESAHSRDMKMAALLNDAFARPTGEIAVADDPEASPKSETLVHRAGRAIATLSPVGHAEAATSARSERRISRREGWSIQVGAFSQRAAAERAATQAMAVIHRGARGRSVLVVAPEHARRGRLYHARIVHFTERDAQAACHALQHRHKACAVIGPDATQMAAK